MASLSEIHFGNIEAPPSLPFCRQMLRNSIARRRRSTAGRKQGRHRRGSGAPISHDGRTGPRDCLPACRTTDRALHSFLKMRPTEPRERTNNPNGGPRRQTPTGNPGFEVARARPEEPVRPPGAQASGLKVKRGAALWLPGQRPDGATEGRTVISTHGNCGGGGGGEKVKKSRLSEQSSGESATPMRVV